jgi:A/G-specific adenine glycosylase
MNLEVKNLTSNAFSTALIDWYDLNKRDLPWRNTDDPYVIWLSEIILQQTRVKQGLPYFQSFLDHFPTVETLADASEQEVLKLWQGLGYYSRARNMLVCARQIVLEWTVPKRL